MKDDIDYYGTFTSDEAIRLGVALEGPIHGEEASEGDNTSEKYGKGEGHNLNVTPIDP